MTAPMMDVEVLRGEVLELRRALQQENLRACTMTRILSALAHKAGDVLTVDGLSFDAIKGRTISVVRPNRKTPDDTPDIVVTLMPEQGDGTATDSKEQPPDTKPRMRIVEP